MANNYTTEIKGKVLIITVNLSKKLGESKSGKSILIASSRGVVPIPGTDFTLNLNVMEPK